MSGAIRQLMLAVLLVLAICQRCAYSQENAQTRIPNSLVECYMNPEIYERDYRLPSTINILIDLIRKIEDATRGSQDIRQIAVGILHRFRLDGIEKAPGVYHGSVLPFSPSGYQFSKHRLLLSRLIPGNARLFPNNTLTSAERCALHFIISSSIDGQVRGDEGSRCNQLQQYSSMRPSNPFEFSRKKRYAPRSNYLCDIEMMKDITDLRRCQRRKYMEHPRTRTTPPPSDGEYDGMDGYDGDNTDNDPYDEENGNDYGLSEHDGLIDVASNAISQCPIENGVMRTYWGSISAGPLIGGIAAGLVQQNVATRELLMLSKSTRNNRLTRQQLSVDNRWAATLAGNLAEVALLQGPINQRDISVGSVGGWNSSTVPHWYFLVRREHTEMTDAQIRGGIDGLVIAQSIAEWRQQASDLRLSQLLDMYYSPYGVFGTEKRSCNRREMFSKNIALAELQNQAHAFTTVLDQEMQLKVTLSNKAIKDFADASAEKLVAYVSHNLQEVSCDIATPYQSAPEIKTAATDLHIFVDTTWQFVEIQSPIAMLLDGIDVSRFGSRVTLYSAQDAKELINTTSSLSDVYQSWSRKIHEEHTPGLNLPVILQKLREIGSNIMTHDPTTNRSFVALIMPQMANLNEADNYFVLEQIWKLRETQPDLTLLFWSGGSLSRFQQFVSNDRKDLFQLVSSVSSESAQQIQTHVFPVIQRLRSMPRKITNPRCSSDWQTSNWGIDTKDQYVESAGVNYYRLHPNYFFRTGGRVQIQGAHQTQIVVCSSRKVENPRMDGNSTQQNEDVYCRQLLPSDSFDIDLRGACDAYYLIKDCPPFYISVGAAPQSAARNIQCNELDCRFPDSIKFKITTENIDCYSSAQAVFSHLVTLIACISFTFVVVNAIK